MKNVRETEEKKAAQCAQPDRKSRYVSVTMKMSNSYDMCSLMKFSVLFKRQNCPTTILGNSGVLLYRGFLVSNRPVFKK